MTRLFALFRTLCFFGWALAGLASPATLQAHEVKEMTIGARVHADRIELRIVASNHMAAMILAEPAAKPPVLNAETFAALRPALEASGRRLCVLSSGEKNAQTLLPSAIDVLLGQDDETEFFITYPPATDGILRIEAAVLDRIEPGYVVYLKVMDAKRSLLAVKALARGDTAITIPLAEKATELTPE